MMNKKLLILLPLALLVILVVKIPKKTPEAFVVGNSIPELRFKDVNGNDYFFNDFRGKVVLINHWATWCQYCLIELPYLEQFRQKYEREDLEIISLLHDTENLDLAKEIIQDDQLSFPILLADDNPALSTIESAGLPYSLLLDRAGSIRFIHRGFTPGDAKKIQSELNYLLDEQ